MRRLAEWIVGHSKRILLFSWGFTLSYLKLSAGKNMLCFSPPDSVKGSDHKYKNHDMVNRGNGKHQAWQGSIFLLAPALWLHLLTVRMGVFIFLLPQKEKICRSQHTKCHCFQTLCLILEKCQICLPLKTSAFLELRVQCRLFTSWD